MATSTTLAIWRSSGGDQTKTAYAGQMIMSAAFYFSPISAAGTAVQKSSTDTSRVILPQNAIVLSIFANATTTGGTSPTFNIGFTGNTTGTATNSGLIVNQSAATAKLVLNWASASTGTSMGAVASSSELVYITGGTGTGTAGSASTVSGYIQYIVSDNGAFTA